MARTVAKTQAEYEANRRFALALILVLAGVGGVLLIAAAVIFASAADADESQMVFSGVIPILGTWVGTVLAFYFARDNLKAATDSAVALAKSETAAETDVSAVMIGLAEIVAEDVQDDAAARALSVKALKKKMLDATPPRGRLPIRDAKGAVLYVLHESTAEKFITSPTRPPGDSPTFGELLDLPEFRG
ncbi:MAG TPA: hypothetical protein VFB52_06945, partial [Solirubrobacterales bacterium]|nr:hypothetical protein [Solirubrobacterales bacterium]